MSYDIEVRAASDREVDRFLARLAGLTRDIEVDVSGLDVHLAIPLGRLAETMPAIRSAIEDLGLTLMRDPGDIEIARPPRPGASPVGYEAGDGRGHQDALERIARDVGGVVVSGPREEWLDGIPGVVLPVRFEPEDQSSTERRRLLLGLESRRTTERRMAAFMLGGWPVDADIAGALRQAIRDNDRYVRAYAAQSLGLMGDAGAGDLVRDIAADLAAERSTDSKGDASPFLAAAVGCLTLGVEDRPLLDRHERFLLDLCREHRLSCSEAVREIAARVRAGEPTNRGQAAAH